MPQKTGIDDGVDGVTAMFASVALASGWSEEAVRKIVEECRWEYYRALYRRLWLQ